MQRGPTRSQTERRRLRSCALCDAILRHTHNPVYCKRVRLEGCYNIRLGLKRSGRDHAGARGARARPAPQLFRTAHTGVQPPRRARPRGDRGAELVDQGVRQLLRAVRGEGARATGEGRRGQTVKHDQTSHEGVRASDSSCGRGGARDSPLRSFGRKGAAGSRHCRSAVDFILGLRPPRGRAEISQTASFREALRAPARALRALRCASLKSEYIHQSALFKINQSALYK